MLVSPLHPCGAGGQRAPQALSSKAEKKSAFVLIKKKNSRNTHLLSQGDQAVSDEVKSICSEYILLFV